MRKKIQGFLLFIILFAAGVIVYGNVQNVQAAYCASVQNLTQTAYGTASASISWDVYEYSYSTESTGSYNIYLKAYNDYSTDYKKVGSTTDKKYTLKGLTDGRYYSVKVYPVSASGEEYTSGSSITIETIPRKVYNLEQERWYYWIKSMTVKWDRVDNADSIIVTFYNGKNKKVNTQKLSGSATSATLQNTKMQVYTVKVQATATVNGKTYKTSIASLKCVHQAMVKSAVVKKKKLTVKWEKSVGATGYEIYMSTKPTTGYKKVKSVSASKSSAVISKFKGKKLKKKTYYVYVITKKKVNGKVYRSGKLYYWMTPSSSVSACKYF